jgi:hypothetical protein
MKTWRWAALALSLTACDMSAGDASGTVTVDDGRRVTMVNALAFRFREIETVTVDIVSRADLTCADFPYIPNGDDVVVRVRDANAQLPAAHFISGRDQSVEHGPLTASFALEVDILEEVISGTVDLLPRPDGTPAVALGQVTFDAPFCGVTRD